MNLWDDNERMSNDDIGHLCRAALRAKAFSAVGDERAVPPMSEPLGSDPVRPAHPVRRRRHVLWALPSGVLIAVAVAATVLVVNHGSGSHDSDRAAAATGQAIGIHSSGGSARPTAPPITAGSTSTTSAQVVHVSALESDGATYGVGMPIVLYFSPVPTDARAFENAVRVTVNGQPVDGAWFWEQPTADDATGHIVEAHYRLENYWPADSKIHVSIPIGGLSAGQGLVYSHNLTSLNYNIGDSHVSLVDAGSLSMRVSSNGKPVRTVPVSLGAAATPTFNGVKVVMQKGEDIPGTHTLRPNGTVMMSGLTYSDDPVQWSVRITESGEYVHAAPWNDGIGQRSTSNGCTNLNTDDAYWFYHFSQVGDVVQYINTDGSTMPSWDGLGDWNVLWSQWSQGGLLQP
jgi:lipoprotein-anchoring transpeptidase ErfK/SrfK